MSTRVGRPPRRRPAPAPHLTTATPLERSGESAIDPGRCGGGVDHGWPAARALEARSATDRATDLAKAVGIGECRQGGWWSCCQPALRWNSGDCVGAQDRSSGRNEDVRFWAPVYASSTCAESRQHFPYDDLGTARIAAAQDVVGRPDQQLRLSDQSSRYTPSRGIRDGYDGSG